MYNNTYDVWTKPLLFANHRMGSVTFPSSDLMKKG